MSPWTIVEATPDPRVLLIYSSSQPDFQDIVERTRSKASGNDIVFEVYDAQELASADEGRFLADIRTIPPQLRGQVKSGGGRTLPISNSGRLNRLIPILIFYEGSKPVDVYPKDIMGVLRDVSRAFKTPRVTESLELENCMGFTALSRV